MLMVSGGAGWTKRAAIQKAMTSSRTNGPTVRARSRQETRGILMRAIKVRRFYFGGSARGFEKPGQPERKRRHVGDEDEHRDADADHRQRRHGELLELHSR